MYRELSLIALLACLPNGRALADPIHAIADGAYWHHGSDWVFPEKIGEFVRVGIPQDVAGSEDAVAHYACVENGTRHTAAVDVYPATSAAAAEHEAAATGELSEGAFLAGGPGALSGTRRIYSTETAGRPALTGVYIINAGEWRVTIRISGSRLETMDAFVRAQHWESLAGH
jgi:hypothetical protein